MAMPLILQNANITFQNKHLVFKDHQYLIEVFKMECTKADIVSFQLKTYMFFCFHRNICLVFLNPSYISPFAVSFPQCLNM